jgi:glucose-1-phosphatase
LVWPLRHLLGLAARAAGAREEADDMARGDAPELAIFDLGNVVFRVDWQPMFELWSGITGRPAADLQARFGVDENLEAFERGQVSPELFHERLCETLGVRLSFAEFEHGWNAIYLGVIGDIDHVLDQLRRRVHVVAFSNTNALHCLVWPELYRDVLARFERIYVSSEIGVRKPEPGGFRRILADHGVAPSRAVFFDDTPLFVDAARALGIRAVLVDSPRAVRVGLAELGLLGPVPAGAG